MEHCSISTPIEEAGFSADTLRALQEYKRFGRQPAFSAIGNLVNYCKDSDAGTARLLNIKTLTPEMVREIRHKIAHLL